MIHFFTQSKKNIFSTFLRRVKIESYVEDIFFDSILADPQKVEKVFFYILGKKWIKKFHQEILFIFWFYEKSWKSFFFWSQQKMNTNFWHRKNFCKIFDSFFTGTKKKTFSTFFVSVKNEYIIFMIF